MGKRDEAVDILCDALTEAGKLCKVTPVGHEVTCGDVGRRESRRERGHLELQGMGATDVGIDVHRGTHHGGGSTSESGRPAGGGWDTTYSGGGARRGYRP